VYTAIVLNMMLRLLPAISNVIVHTVVQELHYSVNSHSWDCRQRTVCLW